MDKLCIDQDDLKEKAKEVRNMYNNYNNSAVTLIAIHKFINVQAEIEELKKQISDLENGSGSEKEKSEILEKKKKKIEELENQGGNLSKESKK